jgi:hypothetical protein
MGVGREGAICEYIEIMQIPPRFERRCAAYKCIMGVLQYGWAAEQLRRTGNTKIRAAEAGDIIGMIPKSGHRFSE